MTKNVLVVTYTFPPTGGAGVQRVSKFVKYLPEFNWNPIVLTALNPSVPLHDDSLLKDVPHDVKIFKTRTYEPSYVLKGQWDKHKQKNSRWKFKGLVKAFIKNILLPDAQVLWWPQLIKSLRLIIKTENISCIFVSSPPYSVLIPTVFIARKYGIPVVSDFRDEWPFSREQWENASKTIFAKLFDSFFEGYVVKKSTKFTAATNSYVQSILKRYPDVQPEKGISITNGFDLDDICQYNEPSQKNKISIVYTGTVWNATSLRIFMEAFHNIICSRPELSTKIVLKIIGRIVQSEIEVFEPHLNTPYLELIGYVDHTKVLAEMSRADILLLSLTDVPGSEKIIPGKTFEYMATGKHILAIVPDGETKNLLKMYYGNVTFAVSGSCEDISQKISEIIKDIELIKNKKCFDTLIFSRKNLTAKLADVLNSCCSPN